jgi:hypothetical protein
MKSIFFGLFLLPLTILAQNEKEQKVYLDSLWRETSEANHKYYRIIESYDSTTETL